MTSTTVPMPAYVLVSRHPDDLAFARPPVSERIAAQFADLPAAGESPTLDAWRRAVRVEPFDAAYVEHFLRTIHPIGDEADWCADLEPHMRDAAHLAALEAALARCHATIPLVFRVEPVPRVIASSVYGRWVSPELCAVAELRASSLAPYWTALYTCRAERVPIWEDGTGIHDGCLMAYARSCAFADVLGFCDTAASSGTLIRPQLAMLRHYVARNLIQRVIVADIEQLSTEAADLALLQKEWEEAGVELLTPGDIEEMWWDRWEPRIYVPPVAEIESMPAAVAPSLREPDERQTTAPSLTAAYRLQFSDPTPVAIYARARGNTPADVALLAAEMAELRDACVARSYHVTVAIQDYDNEVSLDRPSLTVLRAALGTGILDMVVVSSLDSFDLSPSDFALLQEEFEASLCVITLLNELKR
jgi:hypothetical protein